MLISLLLSVFVPFAVYLTQGVFILHSLFGPVLVKPIAARFSH
jgi:hypothetical protein